MSDIHKVSISHNGIPALAGFTFNSSKHNEYKTLLSQEMLKKGFLASTSCYTCLAHTPKVVDLYFNAINDVFSLIGACESGYRNVDDLLDGPVCHSGFKRLN